MIGPAELPVELMHHDEPLAAVVREREGRTGEHGRMGLFGRLFDVLRIVVAAADDDHVFHSASDKQLAVAEEAQVTGSQEFAIAAWYRRGEYLLGLLRTIPIASRDRGT